MKIYVGNMPFSMNEDELRDLFTTHGAVDSVSVVTDRDSGRPRGFAFVEMPDDSAAQAAIDALDGSDASGRRLTVNPARPKPDRGSRGGGRDRGDW